MPSFLTKRFCVLVMLSLAVAWCACNSAKKNEGKAQEILKAAKGGDFRGINLGDNPDDVKRMEDAETVYSMPDELVYRLPPDERDSTWYEISYNFNQQGLYNINLEIFPKNDSGISLLKNDFIVHYSEKYGPCSVLDGYCHWRAMTESGHIVSITLTDSLSNNPRPCLKVNFNESQNQ